MEKSGLDFAFKFGVDAKVTGSALKQALKKVLLDDKNKQERIARRVSRGRFAPELLGFLFSSANIDLKFNNIKDTMMTTQNMGENGLMGIFSQFAGGRGRRGKHMKQQAEKAKQFVSQFEENFGGQKDLTAKELI